MAQALEHRGPDDVGFYFDERAGIGIRRLSIIDIQGGHQPISNEDASKWIVFNGEIYNYRDLKQTLEVLGHTFRSKSDTEVIIHAYEEFGEECVLYLNGIFAFVIWDKTKQKLFAARDRMGVKPFYYHLEKDVFAFGSELKSLLKNPAVERKIDLVALGQYLSFEYVPVPRSMVKGVFKLPPGHTISFSPKGFSLKQYWDISFARSESRPPINWTELKENLRHKLDEAVAREMVSDVPVGVFLSGGIDSAAVAAMMVKHSPQRVKSFSIGFRDKTFDESRYSKLVATHLDTEHHELIVTPDMLLEIVADMADLIDEPFGDSSFVPTYILSRFAREHVKVVMGGDGGDEMFAGYPTYQAHKLVEYYERMLPLFVRAQLIPRLIEMMPHSFDNISMDFKLRRFLGGRGIPLEVRHHQWLGSFTEAEKLSLLAPWASLESPRTYDIASKYIRSTDAQKNINKLLYCDCKLYLEGDILTKVDRASMANSLEVRVPLLNPILFDFVTELPVDLKIRGFTTKYILKKAMSGLIPKEIINRNKKGFNMPVAKWINSDLKELFGDVFSPERLKKRGLFNPAYVQQLISDHSLMKRDNRKLLWTLLVFELWYDRNIA